LELSSTTISSILPEEWTGIAGSTVGVRPPATAHTMAALRRRPIQWEFLYKAVSRKVYRIIAAAGGRITQMSSYFIIAEIPFY
jgi:hypothetical protein